MRRLPVLASWLPSVRAALVAIGTVLGLTGCNNSVQIPPAQLDQPPIVTITSFPSGGGTISPVNISATGNVVVDYGTSIMVMANAQNPGGVKELTVRVIQSGQAVYLVRATAAPDLLGKVPTALFVLGSDGAGNAGSKVALTVTQSNNPLSAEAWADNFNGGHSYVLATFVCSNCDQLAPDHVVGGIGVGGTNACGPNRPCASGSLCCSGNCVASDPRNCGACGRACPVESSCLGQQCAMTPAPSCAPIGASCVPQGQVGDHCCQSPAPALCNFQTCVACTPHGAVLPVFAKQICCDPADQAVSDPFTGQVVCGVPDCGKSPDCPKN